jgi:HlyD family secretion protein
MWHGRMRDARASGGHGISNQGKVPKQKSDSADVIQDQRSGEPYFLVRISMSLDELARLNGLRLVPGMPVEAFIRTDERTMLSYFFKPLTDQARRAFREK